MGSQLSKVDLSQRLASVELLSSHVLLTLSVVSCCQPEEIFSFSLQHRTKPGAIVSKSSSLLLFTLQPSHPGVF